MTAHRLSHNRVSVLHGVNFDVLERRDPKLYGGFTLAQLERQIAEYATAHGLQTRFFQTNSEAEFVEHLHRLPDFSDAVVINAGAWTHYSYGIGDALALTNLPAVEVHLSDVDAREDFRRISVFEGYVLGKIAGKGVAGYDEALALIANHLEDRA